MPVDNYDVVIVGSGASGGWAAKLLSESGLQVAVLDCGRPQRDANFTEHVPVYKLKYRNLKFREPVSAIIRQTRPVQGQCYACTEWNYEWFANDHDEPYTTAENMPYNYFGRLRVIGGRTNVWGRLCFRLSDLDFKAASHDGFGENWPIEYKDVAPYYDLVERYVGVTGMPEGQSVLPDGIYQPPMGFSCAELKFRETAKQRFGRIMTQGRSANLTLGINGRQPCHYCGPCERGCITHSYFNSSFTTMKDALATGKCKLIPNASAYRVLMNSSVNRANGILYVDRVTKQSNEIRARVVVLAASAMESTRILLNSANRQYPKGLANSSGVLGHYYTDSLKGGSAEGIVPDPPKQGSIDGPHRPNSIYVMRFRNIPGSPKMQSFLRGYGLQGSSGRGFNATAPGFGEAYKKAAIEPRERFTIQCYGEALPRFENYVELDPNVRDIYGIPVLRFHVAWGDNERNMIKDAAEQCGEMLEAAGVKNVKTNASLHLPGDANHDVGTARMGDDPKKSVLNKFNQTHDIKNLFVMDGACFNSSGCQNPTLTIMALAVRSTHYLLDELRKADI
ncbi:MAG TPA: GMC family oxidoreductase [Bryobacteraceae bacterium]|nr:GMC family oxidoreductase [Bryobacteraceae bacterium]